MTYKSKCVQQWKLTSQITALFQKKGHWAVTERFSEKKKKVHNASEWQHINLGKHQHVVCLTHVCLCLSQMNSTTKRLLK